MTDKQRPYAEDLPGGKRKIYLLDPLLIGSESISEITYSNRLVFGCLKSTGQNASEVEVVMNMFAYLSGLSVKDVEKIGFIDTGFVVEEMNRMLLDEQDKQNHIKKKQKTKVT